MRDAEALLIPSFHLDGAVRALRAGGIVAYPTEGVYGLGCDPASAEAVETLLRLKQRDPDKGLLLIAADVDQLRPWLALDDATLERLRAHWPDATTYVLPAAPTAPAGIRGRHATLAVRVTRHPVAAALCRAFGGPIVSTSANYSGRPAARNRFQVARHFRDRLDWLLAGECGGRGRPSTIIDFATGATLRA